MSRSSGPTTAGVVLLVGAIGLLTSVMLLARMLGVDLPDGCSVGSDESGVVLASSDGADSLNATQTSNAEAVVAEGRRRDLPDQAIVIALAVAHQESRFLNYANDGQGDDLIFSQQGIEKSLELPHQAVGTDHGSLGIFQQQWPWWGSMRDLMTPAAAAGKFYGALVQVSGWSTMPLTVAAQRVQRSAFPDAYADDEPLARALLAELLPALSVETASWTPTVAAECLPATAAGSVVHPLPAAAGYTDQDNWGATGTAWAAGHTGTDLAAACGTPVLASHAGTVTIRTDQSWSGRWLVMVSTGEGQLTTWYAHMRTVRVAHGQTVVAGQPIGEVGDLGNASGCHLHFEVHPQGASIYEDGVNPSEWLRDHVGEGLTGDSTPGVSAGPFTLATFNVLGHGHTTASGKHPGMASGPERMAGALDLLDRWNVDVVGLQELQGVQRRELLRLAGERYAVFSPPGDTENSIAWRRERWAFVRGETFAVPYFNGNPRQMPIVELRSRTTGTSIIVVNVHNPANTSRFPDQGQWRAEAVRREVALVRRIAATTTAPVFLVGDLNDRHDAYCALSSEAGMVASNGGSNVGTCLPPSNPGIDWIFGTAPAQFSSHQVDLTAKEAVSDHPLVMAHVN